MILETCFSFELTIDGAMSSLHLYEIVMPALVAFWIFPSSSSPSNIYLRNLVSSPCISIHK